MSFADGFRKRLSMNGTSDAEAIYNQSFELFNKTFTNSPNYKIIEIEGQRVEARVLEGKTWMDKVILLRPNNKAKIGSHVEIDGTHWMVFEALTDNISPKLIIQHRNEHLRWRDVDGLIHEASVMASATRNTKFDITPDKFDIGLVVGGIYVFAKVTDEVRTIVPSQRFIIGNYVYEVAGVDDVTNVDSDGNGYLQITCKLTTKRESDDWIARVADNSQLIESENGTQEGGNDLW